MKNLHWRTASDWRKTKAIFKIEDFDQSLLVIAPMRIKCPSLSDTIIVSDDAQLAAQLSCAFARPKTYLPIIDGPRMQRPDYSTEIIHRTNAIGRSRAKRIILAGLKQKSETALISKLPSNRVIPIHTIGQLSPSLSGPLLSAPLKWGNKRIGIGLLLAMRERRSIAFEDKPSPETHVAPKSEHLVVCEDGDDLAQVVAANYAYSLGAGLLLIPATPKERVEQILERFYSVYDNRDQSPSETLRGLGEELRGIAGSVPIPAGGSITFISDGLPFGFAFPEVPSTHLFSYPYLGITTLHGFAAEQSGERGVQVAALVNPETTPAPEIEAAARLLAEQRMFVRAYEGPSADVTSISQMVELFPYDLLIIATHCGDVSGHRWTYEFIDSEGLPRTLVVDIALGIGRTEESELLQVTQFLRFISLDGVPWNDREKKSKLYIGTAMNDFMSRISRNANEILEPTIKDKVDRVVGSAALKMYDNNFIALPRSLANNNTPIIVNNACVSWHRLASNFLYGGARGYIGTLFPISTSEAESVLIRALNKHRGKALPHAFWSAQRETYGNNPRRPYIVAGIFPQRIEGGGPNVPTHITRELTRGRTMWQQYRDNDGPHDGQRKRVVDSHIKFFEEQIDWFRKRW